MARPTGPLSILLDVIDTKKQMATGSGGRWGEASLLLVARPGAPSSFVLLVASCY